MKIVGGTYWEISHYPESTALFGSGLKAAAAISSLSTKVELESAVSQEDLAEAEGIASTFGITSKFHVRTSRIEFQYFTPLTTPRIVGAVMPALQMDVSSDNVLAFGMLEAEHTIRAKKVVLDPQRPTGPSIDRARIQCEKLAIVLNRHEASLLTGLDDPEAAAKQILAKFKANAVVVKCGALGAHVVEGAASKWIGAHPSPNVWPIGSGDIFSAVFSTAWLEGGEDAVSSAKFASAAVSLWAREPNVLPLAIDIRARAKSLEPPLEQKVPLVYLAGPFFCLSQDWLIETARHALKNLGAKVFSPVHEVGRGGDEVAIEDLKGLDQCDSVLALLDDLDEGTIFEVGYACAKGKKVIGFSQQKDSAKLKMLRGSGIPIYDDFTSAVYHSIWAGI